MVRSFQPCRAPNIFSFSWINADHGTKIPFFCFFRRFNGSLIITRRPKVWVWSTFHPVRPLFETLQWAQVGASQYGKLIRSVPSFWEWEPDDWATGRNISFDFSKSFQIEFINFLMEKQRQFQVLLLRHWRIKPTSSLNPMSVEDELRPASSGIHPTVNAELKEVLTWTPLLPSHQQYRFFYLSQINWITSFLGFFFFCPGDAATALPHWPDLEADRNQLPPGMGHHFM
jgi:hypothetical protein